MQQFSVEGCDSSHDEVVAAVTSPAYFTLLIVVPILVQCLHCRNPLFIFLFSFEKVNHHLWMAAVVIAKCCNLQSVHVQQISRPKFLPNPRWPGLCIPHDILQNGPSLIESWHFYYTQQMWLRGRLRLHWSGTRPARRGGAAEGRQQSEPMQQS